MIGKGKVDINQEIKACNMKSPNEFTANSIYFYADYWVTSLEFHRDFFERRLFLGVLGDLSRKRAS